MPKGLDDQSFFIHGNLSWKVSYGFLELEDFTLALWIEVLESLILMLLLNGHMQVIKSWKISSSLFELKDFTLALAMDMLEGFILELLLKAMGEREKTAEPDCHTIDIKSSWAQNNLHLKWVTFPHKAYTYRSVGSNIQNPRDANAAKDQE